MSDPNVFGAGEISLDDLERLATTFRPSWELDDAPFAGAASFSAADIRSLQGGDAHAAVRATVHAAKVESFSTHASSEKSFASQSPPYAVVAAGSGIAVSTPRPRASVAPGATPSRAPARPVAGVPVYSSRPAARPTPPSLDFSESLFTRSKTPPLIALGVVAAIAIGVGVWATSSSGARTPPAPAEVIAPSAATAAEATSAASLPTPPAVVAPPAIAPPPPPVVAALPSPPHVYAPPSLPAARPVYAPAPKPAARPKASNPTIVRDVPF